MFHTPAKNVTSQSKTPEKTSPRESGGTKVAQARRSLESQIERSEGTSAAGPVRPRPRGAPMEGKGVGKKTTAPASAATTPPREVHGYVSRTTEAKACLMKIKLQINNSRNLKTEIKNDVMEATDRLYKLVKESEEGRTKEENMDRRSEEQVKISKGNLEKGEIVKELEAQGLKLIKKIDEHSQLLENNRKEMEKVKEELEKQREEWKEARTYANVVAVPKEKRQGEAVLHSVVITSEDQTASGEEVFEKIRTTLNAREEGLQIDKIRKAKDRKIIVGCKSKEELRKVKDKIRTAGRGLNMEEMTNKEPMILLRDVLNHNKDEEIVRALLAQNKNLLGDVIGDSACLKVKFRRRARNPLTSHVAIQVPPTVWKRLTEAG